MENIPTVSPQKLPIFRYKSSVAGSPLTIDLARPTFIFTSRYPTLTHLPFSLSAEKALLDKAKLPTVGDLTPC